MSMKRRKFIAALTLAVIVSILQTYVGVSYAAGTSGPPVLPSSLQDVTGILATDGNKPILVNGVSTITGATVVSNTTIETPDMVGASISIPGHGILQVKPNTKLTIEFDQNGNIKVNVSRGCVVLSTMKGTSGVVVDPQGVVRSTDSSQDGVVDICPGRSVVPAAAGAGGLFGLGTAATIAIVAGGIGAIAAIAVSSGRGSNPSPSSF